MPAPLHDWSTLQALLEALGRAVRDTFLEIRRETASGELARVSHETAADTIYAIDQAVEGRILDWLEEHWPRAHPVQLVMEGLEEPRVLPSSSESSAGALTLIIDPLDGTREIMWNRRSAWFLAALAPTPAQGVARLGEIEVAVMVELPPTHHRGCHLLSARRAARPRALFLPHRGSPAEVVALQPHQGPSLAHGFVSIGSPFYQGKARVGAFAEAFLARYFDRPLDGLPIFDDQYISSGGQVFELMTGRSRLVADLRPYFLDLDTAGSPLACHPYDICTALIAQRAGCVIEKPDGSPLGSPLDTLSPVAFIGYANEAIAERARPIVRDLLPMLAPAHR